MVDEAVILGPGGPRKLYENHFRAKREWQKAWSGEVECAIGKAEAVKSV